MPAHELDELAGNGQAQPGAAKAAAQGRVDLDEGLENLPQVFRRHADAGVAHRNDEVEALAHR